MVFHVETEKPQSLKWLSQMWNELKQYKLVWLTVSLLHYFDMGDYNYIKLVPSSALIAP